MTEYKHDVIGREYFLKLSDTTIQIKKAEMKSDVNRVTKQPLIAL